MLPDDFVRLGLLSMFLGGAAGFFLTGLVNTLLDLLMRLDDRRERIDAARHRDHSKVPTIHGGPL